MAPIVWSAVTVLVTLNLVTLSCASPTPTTTPAPLSTTPDSELLDSSLPNPCTQEHIQASLLYWAYPPDPHRFIQCESAGVAWVQPCSEQQVWDQREQTCVMEGSRPTGTTTTSLPTTPPANPCTPEAEAAGNNFFPYPCDHTSFIQCGVLGQSFVQHCPADMFFDPSIHICVTGDPQHTPDCP